MCSNSSFTDCVKKNAQPSHFQLFQSSNVSPSTCRDDCLFSTNRPSLSSTETFTSCVWSNCKAQYGGGIFLNVSNSAVSLTVKQSQFYSCQCSYLGGGLYVEGIGKVTIEDTIFLECIADSKSGLGGGGIGIVSPQKPPQIQSCFLHKCTAADDAGGLGIWRTPFYQATCVKECRIFECSVKSSGESGGGGMAVWYSPALIGCSECIFSKCHSAFIGGALGYDITFSSPVTQFPLSSFCFFYDNTAKKDCGNDAFFVERKPADPFLHSFSTSASHQITYMYTYNDWRNVNEYTHEDNWIDQSKPLIISYCVREIWSVFYP